MDLSRYFALATDPNQPPQEYEAQWIRSQQEYNIYMLEDEHRQDEETRLH